MKTSFSLLAAMLLFISCSQNGATKTAESFSFPATKEMPVTNTYFGLNVTDNYQWLENMKDPSVLNWFKSQADYTNSWLNKIPGRDSLVADFTRLDKMKTATIGGLKRKGNRYFFKKTLPGEKTGKLYYRDGKNGEDMLLYDPGFDKDSVPYSINGFTPDEGGQKVAIGITKGGAEVTHIRVMNVADKKFYTDDIYPSRGSAIGWSPDNRGFLYMWFQTPDNHSMEFEMNTRTMYHVLNTDTTQDKEIFSMRKYPNLGIRPSDFCISAFSDDFKYLFATLSTVDRDMVTFYAPAADFLKPEINWSPLTQKKDHVTDLVTAGDDVYMQTYNGAPNYKVIKSNLKNFSVAKAETIIPEAKDHISGMGISKDYLFITYNNGIDISAITYNLHTGKSGSVNLPLTGSGGLIPYDTHANDANLIITSWKQPITVYDYNADDQKTEISPFNIENKFPGTDDLVVVETQAKSYDGTMVPLSIIYNKSVKLDGKANCLMRGYGAYGSSMTPAFSIMNLALLNRGIVLAFAHIRGGGENGESWYKAGFQTTKPNTWKDFIACAEYLIQNKYTSKNKLSGMGTSAGGITIGRAITERPDLFGAAIDNVGCSNALRLEETPNGPVNAPEFGTIKDSVQSRALYEMDALHHVKNGTEYPAVICVGGMNDPRVSPWQPGKFAAALQKATSSGKPVLMSVNYDDGHFTEDKSVTFKNFANMYSFCLWQTGNKDFQLKQ